MPPKKDENLAKTMGCIIKKFREKLFPGHGGKKKCAEQFGINAQMWGDWEGGRKLPGDANQKKLAVFFDISMAELRGEVTIINPTEMELDQLKGDVKRLTTENKSLKAEVNQLRTENTELQGALKHLKDLISTPKTASDVSIPSRITRIKTPSRRQ